MDSKTPFHLSGSEVISGTEDKRPNIITKDVPIPLIAQEMSRVWGTVDEDQIYLRNIL